MAKAEGAGIQDEDGIERALAAPPQHGIPGRRALPGRRPRRTTGQGRPRLRDSLAGGSIRSRRPARESGRNTEWAQIPDSSPPFRAFPWLRSVTAARRATGKLTALWAGASSGRPAEGHRRRRRRVRARWPTRSSRAWRRSDGRNRERCGMRPIPVTAGAAATHARPPRARAAARVLRGAQRALLRAAGALLPARLLATAADLTAGLRGVPALPGSQVAGSVFLRVPRGAILLPVMAGGAWRGNSAVYVGAFCGSEEEGCQAPFQGCAEAGYRAKQDTRKPDICMDRARSPHTIAAIQRTPVNPWREISR